MTAEACAKNPLTRYINTDATARDMDLMRHLLGDEKFNYYGISYGTWLGTWYTALFLSAWAVWCCRAWTTCRKAWS